MWASSSNARRSHCRQPRPPARTWRLRAKKRHPVLQPLVILKAAALSCGASCSRDVEGAPRAAAPDDEYEAPARQRLAPEGERWRCRAAPPCLCAERQRQLKSDLSRNYLSRVCSLALNRSLSSMYRKYHMLAIDIASLSFGQISRGRMTPEKTDIFA